MAGLAAAMAACATALADPGASPGPIPAPTTQAPVPAPAASPTPIRVRSTSGATTTTTTSVSPSVRPRPAPAAHTSEGARITAVQKRLADLGYDPGPADGKVGERTRDAVVAFQKVEGLARTGTIDARLAGAVTKASRPRPLVSGGTPTRIEVDLRRQVLLFWESGSLRRVLPVSTGSGRTYCVAGKCERAVTPAGTFSVERKVAGTDLGPLGEIYSPMYFNRGVAIHGYPSVPVTPASHGCVRIPMYAASELFDQVSVGTPVHVVSGA